MRHALPTFLGLALVISAVACSGSKSASTAAVANGAPPSTPASVSCASFASPTATASSRALLYSTLTATTWTNTYCGSSCLSLTLGQGGGYTLSFPSGYYGGTSIESHVDSGSWNFAVIDSTRGVVCLDGAVATPTRPGGQANLPSVLHFELPTSGRGQQLLRIGPYGFTAGESQSRTSAAADALPNVAVSPAFAALAGATWSKTNAFDPTTAPQAFIFDASGRFTATFGGGACTQSGTISIDRDTMLTTSDQGQTCTGNSYPGRVPNQVVPGFFDDLLVLGQGSYRRSDAAAGKPNAFVFDPYGQSVRVTGTYDGALKAGAATTIALTFENADPALIRTLGTFTATIQPATVNYGQAQTAGKLVPLGSVDLAGVTLGPGEKHYATIAVTPPAAGDTFALQMRVTFADVTKKYDGEHTFMTAVTQ